MKLLYNRALDEKIACLSRLDSYRNFGLITITFAFATYVDITVKGIDPFWRFVLTNVSFIIVFHFFMLETINTIYIWNYNNIMEKAQDLLLSGHFEKEIVAALYGKINDVHRVRSLQQTLKERVRTPLFTFVIMVKLIWIYELVSDISWINYKTYLVVVVLYLFWWGYEIWNIITYHLFSYAEPVPLEDKASQNRSEITKRKLERHHDMDLL